MVNHKARSRKAEDGSTSDFGQKNNAEIYLLRSITKSTNN